MAPVLLQPAARPKTTFESRQEWEGTVDVVTDQGIVATLRDITNPSTADELAEIVWDEISDADRDLVTPGAVFYWNIGYEKTVFGQRSGKSVIRFRRLPAWTKSEIAAVDRDANELARHLGLDTSSGRSASST